MKIYKILLICIALTLNLNAKQNDLPNEEKNLNLQENVDVSFEFETSASIYLTDTLEKYLEKVAIYMKENPGSVLGITGHSDDQGTMQENQSRSDKRATAVVDFLVSKGISNARLLPNGRGSIEPLASNKSEMGRKKNRRVAIRIVPSARDLKNK